MSMNKEVIHDVTRRRILNTVREVQKLIPLRIPYNGGLQKNLTTAKDKLEQIEASLVNCTWITKDQLDEIKRGN